MTSRNDYIESMKTRLDRWNSEIAKWEAQSRIARTDLRIEYEMQLESLRKHRDDAKEKLDVLQQSAGDAWQDLAQGADEAWAKMRAAFEKARTHFQK